MCRRPSREYDRTRAGYQTGGGNGRLRGVLKSPDLPPQTANASFLTLSSRQRRRIEGRGESNASRRVRANTHSSIAFDLRYGAFAPTQDEECRGTAEPVPSEVEGACPERSRGTATQDEAVWFCSQSRCRHSGESRNPFSPLSLAFRPAVLSPGRGRYGRRHVYPPHPFRIRARRSLPRVRIKCENESKNHKMDSGFRRNDGGGQ